MGQSKIRWSDNDERALKATINAFNRKLNALTKANPDFYKQIPFAPEKISLKEARTAAQKGSRQDFKIEVAKMKRFQRPDAALPYTTTKGVNITLWEKREVENEHRRMNQRAQAALRKTPAGKDRDVMGDEKREEVKPRKNRIEQIEPESYRDYRKGIHKQSQSIVSQDDNWRENYIKSVEDNLGGDEQLIRRFKAMTPAQLRAVIDSGNPILSIKFHYDPKQSKEIADAINEQLDEMFGEHTTEMPDGKTKTTRFRKDTGEIVTKKHINKVKKGIKTRYQGKG